MTRLLRLICVLGGHRPASRARARWTFCMRCQTNYYTGGARGR